MTCTKKATLRETVLGGILGSRFWVSSIRERSTRANGTDPREHQDDQSTAILPCPLTKDAEVKLGFLGLGRMGLPMAQRLLEAGFPLTVWNRTVGKADGLAQAGAEVVVSPARVAETADIVLSVLRDDDAAREVFGGPEGLLSVPVEGKLFIEMSTLRAQTARELAASCEELGARFIDSPVSGTVGPAKEGRLMALVGGAEADLERAVPVLDVLTRRIVHVGPVGQGSLMKLVINLPLAAYWQSLSEAAAMGHAGGLDLALMMDVMKDSGASLAAFPKKIPEILGESRAVAFDIDTLHKDVESILETGREFRVPMALTETVLSACEAARQSGLGSEDAVALVRFLIGSLDEPA